MLRNNAAYLETDDFMRGRKNFAIFRNSEVRFAIFCYSLQCHYSAFVLNWKKLETPACVFYIVEFGKAAITFSLNLLVSATVP